MSTSRNNNENLKNKLEQVREQIQERSNYIKQLEQVQQHHGLDTIKDRFDASNQVNKLKDQEAKLEDKLMKKGVSYQKFF